MGLFYESKDTSIGLFLVKSSVPEEGSFTEFSKIVSQDNRIPSKYETKVGILNSKNSIDDFKDAKIWLPHKSYKNTLGVALMPRILIANDNWVKDVYAYAFQGKDEKEAYISGLKGYKNSQTNDMKLVLSGVNISSNHLERAAQTFFDKTGLKSIDFEDFEKEEFDKGHKEILNALAVHNFHKHGLFMYTSLFASKVGDKIIQTDSVEIR